MTRIVPWYPITKENSPTRKEEKYNTFRVFVDLDKDADKVCCIDDKLYVCVADRKTGNWIVDGVRCSPVRIQKNGKIADLFMHKFFSDVSGSEYSAVIAYFGASVFPETE